MRTSPPKPPPSGRCPPAIFPCHGQQHLRSEDVDAEFEFIRSLWPCSEVDEMTRTLRKGWHGDHVKQAQIATTPCLCRYSAFSSALTCTPLPTNIKTHEIKSRITFTFVYRHTVLTILMFVCLFFPAAASKNSFRKQT